MDPSLLSKFAEQGVLIFGMAIIIGALYMENRGLKKENDTVRDNFQTKYEALLVKVIELTSNSARQLDSFNATITAMTATLSTWRDEFLKGRKDQ